MKVKGHVTTFALISFVLSSQLLLAQSSSNRFSDGEINEINKAMKERAAAEEKVVPQARVTTQPKEAPKLLPDSISKATKEIADIDTRLILNSMGLESADDHQATVGEMTAKYGPDWATSKNAQAKIEKDALEKKARLAKQKIELQQRRAVLVNHVSTCKIRVGECKQ